MTIHEELEQIKKEHRGLLRPVDVVGFALHPETALHSKFQWDDEVAGHEYRLWQAREIIQVHIIILEGTDKPIRAYVSLINDRSNPGGGYRSIIDVLKNKERREQLLAQALAELEVFRAKYEQLQELAPLFKAMDKLKTKEKVA